MSSMETSFWSDRLGQMVSSEHSMLSTEDPVASSAGVSEMSFMRRWVQLPPEWDGLEFGYFGWTREYSGLSISHAMLLRPMEEAADVSAALGRVACHLLVEHIPDRGMPELCRTLLDMREFYWQPPSSSKLLPEGERVSARLGRTYERAPFSIDDEE